MEKAICVPIAITPEESIMEVSIPAMISTGLATCITQMTKLEAKTRAGGMKTAIILATKYEKAPFRLREKGPHRDAPLSHSEFSGTSPACQPRTSLRRTFCQFVRQKFPKVQPRPAGRAYGPVDRPR